MSREGAGRRAWQTRRDNAMRAQMTALRAQYDSPGKRQVRALLHAVARDSGVATVLEFLGGGEGAEEWAKAGFEVTVAEQAADRKALLRWLAERVGFTPFPGRASRLKRPFDLIFADLDGPLAEGGSEPELHRLAAMTGKWLAVTVSPDRQREELLQAGKVHGSRYADATMASRLVAITALGLVYMRRYQRNDLGQWMWVALLRRVSKNTHHMLDPLTIHANMSRRGYWASHGFRQQFSDLLPHKYGAISEARLGRQSVTQRAQYADLGSTYRQRCIAYRETHREQLRVKARARYRANREQILTQQRARRRAGRPGGTSRPPKS